MPKILNMSNLGERERTKRPLNENSWRSDRMKLSRPPAENRADQQTLERWMSLADQALQGNGKRLRDKGRQKKDVTGSRTGLVSFGLDSRPMLEH